MMPTMMFLSRILLLIAVAVSCVSTNLLTAQAQTYSCSYSDPMLLEGWGEGQVTLQHYANLQEETFTVRLTVDQESWLAIGINLDGGHSMQGSFAVIGSIQDGVQWYWMTSEDEDASGVMELEDVHGQITNKSFQQTDDGETILEFTMNMAIADEDEAATVYHYVGEDSAFIWGAGLPGNQWQGVHRTLGFFSGLQPYDGCEVAVTESPTATPEAVTTSNPGQDEDMTETTTPDEDTTTNTTTGSGSSTTTPTTSSTSPPAAPASSSSSSAGASSLVFGQARESDATRYLWVSHGILMAMAWGIFVPIAIGAAYLKKMAWLQKNALWLSLHSYCTVAAIAFTFVGFVVGVIAAQKEGDLPHFSKDTHHKAGLTVFVLVLLQGLAGYFRPANASASSDDSASESASSSASLNELNDTMDNGDDVKTEMQENVQIQTNAKPSSTTKTGDVQKSTPSRARQYWEYFHRFLGMTLLGLAWYNCTSGIELQAAKYDEDDEERLMTIFWSITGLIAGIIFVMGYVIRVE